jgi:hypothetical protein
MNATIARRKSGTRTRERIPMKKLRAGRPARLDYEPGALCQLNVEMSPVLKREIVERAERNENRLSDEFVWRWPRGVSTRKRSPSKRAFPRKDRN